MSAVAGVRCDGCGRTNVADALDLNAGQVRAALKRRGWHKTRGEYQSVSGIRGYSRDICPTCWTEGKR